MHSPGIIYLRPHQRRIARTGRHAGTILSARDEMQTQTGLDTVALSRRLAALSPLLIIHHPLPYLEGVAEAGARFWSVPLHRSRDRFVSPAAAQLLEALWARERVVLHAVNRLAVLACGWTILAAFWRRMGGAIGAPAPWLLRCVVLAASVFPALTEFGDNPRYPLPTQSRATTLVLRSAWDARAASGRRPAARRHPTR